MEETHLTLQNKKIVVAVTGSVAAFKAVDIVRDLVELGAKVQVILTATAREFVTPLTMQIVSAMPVHTEAYSVESPMLHIELARWADAILIAPASAHVMAKLAHGLADDLLSTVCLASNKPIWLAPAMNQQMWNHPATVNNVSLLKSLGMQILGPGLGQQACGDFGPGRMLEPTEIVASIQNALTSSADMRGMHVLITAGPTREFIDPVRFNTNLSSGKMGYALAIAARQAGATVTLISGPTQLAAPAGVKTIAVISAKEMHEQVMQYVKSANILIAAAAVADYRPCSIASQKIKKSSEEKSLPLVKNADIIAEVAKLDNPPYLVGFAAETENLIENARHKMQYKGMDMIVANWVGGSKGFQSDYNAARVLTAQHEFELGLMLKQDLASKIIKIIAENRLSDKARPEATFCQEAQ